MLLTLFRLIMIVPLLISAVCQVEANREKLSFVPSMESKSVDESRLTQSAALLNQDPVPDDNDSEFQEEERKVDNEQEMRSSRNSFGSAENRFARSEGGNRGLAHKMAKDALKSPKMQETMRRLSHVKSPKGTLHASVKVPGVKVGPKMAEDRRRSKDAKHKGRRKKKRKRHHRRFRTQHAGPLKRGSSKRTSDDKKDINVNSDGTGSSLINRKQAVLDDSERGEKSKQKATVAVDVDDADYVDFSSPLNTERSILITQSQKREPESMVERLMRTTTKDPSRKSQGDTGVEYSDYYSDDEVLQDIAANKIPVQLIDSSGPSNVDRIARQAINFTSAPLRVNRNVHPRHADSRKKVVRYKGDAVNTLNDFQSQPRIERLLRRNPRVLEADDPTLGYQINYGSPDDYRNENYDASYPANVASGQISGDGDDVPSGYSSRYNDDFEPIDARTYDPSEIQQPAEQEIPDHLNYLNQYEIPEHLQNLSPSESDTNINEVEPQLPQSFNYQPEANLPPADDFQQNVINQPALENARLPSLREEDVEFHTQSSYAPLQLYGNHDDADQAVRNYLIQSKFNYPLINAPNAMDQPLGKVLESLGINVNGGSNGFNQNPSLSEGVNHQITPYAMEHLISPNYLKKKPQKESSNYYEGNNARGSEFEENKLRNRNNIREGLRRHSQNGDYNNNILKQLEEEKPMHNMNISIAVHDTKEVANQILDTIMEELEELKADKSKNNKREGSWSTAQAGVKLDMKVVNRTITVTLSEPTGQPLHESLLNATWNISGHVPFKRGAPFSLTATDNSTNSIAVFVGSCRVCQGIDTIAGVWSIARQPKGCKDFQVSTTVFNDIFRKSKLSSLKEKGANSTENTTKHEKRKS